MHCVISKWLLPHFYVAPGKVENLTATQTEKGFVLTWELPEEAQSLHDSITIIYSCSCQDEMMTIESVSSGNSFLVDNLTPGINCSVEVIAQNVLGYAPKTEGTIVQTKVGMQYLDVTCKY